MRNPLPRGLRNLVDAAAFLVVQIKFECIVSQATRLRRPTLVRRVGDIAVIIERAAFLILFEQLCNAHA